LQQALSRHSRIVIPPETGFFSDIVGRSRARQLAGLQRINDDLRIDLPRSTKRIRDREQAKLLYERLAELYLERVGRNDVTYFGEKTPRHLNHVHKIIDLYPDAKIIAIIRDGRDVALSLTEVPWGPKSYYHNLDRWLRDYRCYQRLLRDATIDVLDVRYEDLTTRPVETLQRLTDFLDLPYEPSMAEGNAKNADIPERELGWKARATATIDRSRVARWRKELSEEQIACVERWGGDALRLLGYELVTDGSRPLPPGFFAHLRWHKLVWYARAALRSLRGELPARRG
jgi:hypothetical protein